MLILLCQFKDKISIAMFSVRKNVEFRVFPIAGEMINHLKDFGGYFVKINLKLESSILDL